MLFQYFVVKSPEKFLGPLEFNIHVVSSLGFLWLHLQVFVFNCGCNLFCPCTAWGCTTIYASCIDPFVIMLFLILDCRLLVIHLESQHLPAGNGDVLDMITAPSG